MHGLCRRADLINWEYTIKYNRTVGLNSWSVELIGFITLAAFIAVPILAYRVYRLLRNCLDRGIKIPKDRKFIDWRPCWLLFPLACGFTDTAVGVAHDGTLYTRSFSYGSAGSIPH